MTTTMLTPYKTQGAAEMSSVGDSALNWYSRRLARELVRADVAVEIVGPKLPGARSISWMDDGIEVHSAFARRSLTAVWQAYARIIKLRNDLVHIQHELFAYGGLSGGLMLPLMLGALRRRGLKLLTTIHGVIPLSEVSDDFVRANRIPANAAAARALWRLLIRRVALASDLVHVHEEFLRDLLLSDYGLRDVPVVVIPFGVEAQGSTVSRPSARAALHIPVEAEVALFFGYLSAYKGIEYLLDELPAMLRERPNLHVVLAGSVPERLTGTIEPHAVIERFTAGRERVHLLGFVPDGDMAMMFGAADVLLLPYRVAMSSSGPLALAMGFDVPVLMSTAFERLFPRGPRMFELQPGALTCELSRFFDDAATRSQARAFVDGVRANRSWRTVAQALAAVYQDLAAS